MPSTSLPTDIVILLSTGRGVPSPGRFLVRGAYDATRQFVTITATRPIDPGAGHGSGVPLARPGEADTEGVRS